MRVFPHSACAWRAVAAALVLSACGGRSERDGARGQRAASDGAGAGAANDAPQDAGGAPRAAPSSLALRFAVPLAQPEVGFDPFALEPPVLLAFSPDGSRLAFAPNSAARDYDAVTGALLGAAAGAELALARNRAFTLELENDGGALALTELASGAVRWEVPAPAGLLVAAFSGDDRYALAFGCAEAGATLERFRVADGVRDASVALGRCLGSRVSFSEPLPALVVGADGAEAIVTAVSGDADPAGDAAAAAGGSNATTPFDSNVDVGAVWRVALDGGELTAFEAVATRGATLLALAGAAGGGALAALGSDGELVFRGDVASEPAWPAVPTSTAKLDCYFVPPLVLPLAVSADARLLAAASLDGRALVLRRTTDGAELARAVGPGNARCDVGAPPLPLLAAFDAGSALLAVVWDSALAVYDVQ